MRRRQFLTAMAAASGSAMVALPAWAGPAAASAPDARFVVLVLRGGLDGLAAVPAHGDPHYRRARGDLALPGPSAKGGVIDLDGTFGLHQSLAPLKPLYDAKQLLVAHAVAAPYRLRSHFDGQNVLESGGTQPFATRSGWLSRALPATNPDAPLAVGKQVPLLLRGPNGASSLDPLRTPRPDDPFHEAVAALYTEDPALGDALARGRAAQRLLARHSDGRTRQRRTDDGVASARVVARLLSDPEGPRTAVFSMGGWDTHANQGPRLARQLESLGKALEAFSSEMTPAVWSRTAILVITEFGRTVAPNGTGGTDHGVGGVALLAGGAVRGGRVIADWPGLAERQRLDRRDLRPTLDVRSLTKGVLHEHLAIARSRLDTEVFPNSADVAPLRDLVTT